MEASACVCVLYVLTSVTEEWVEREGAVNVSPNVACVERG